MERRRGGGEERRGEERRGGEKERRGLKGMGEVMRKG